MTMRRPLIAGNWKLHCGPTEARTLARDIHKGVLGAPEAVDVLVCPPFVSLAAVREIVHDGPVQLGAQNVFWEEKGAWTGEVAPSMLRDAGCDWTLVGHSERRQHFGDTDDSVRRRLEAARAGGLRVILCVGETLQERQAGQTSAVVTRQVRTAVAGCSTSDWPSLVLAYEPVWAIGTGHNATPAQAQEVHEGLRALVGELASDAVGRSMRILYGGSVKPDNAAELLGQSDVDGALVGGASLEAAGFLAIVEAARAL
jgi:triosephosphate isomerase